MAYLRLALKPGIDKQNTEYGAEGGWIDGDFIRFRYGLPEKLGGWLRFNNSIVNLVGLATDIFTWNSLDGSPNLMVGTNKKLYAFQGGTFGDVTPIRETTAAGAVTFAAVDGSATLTVTDTAHGAVVGDFVTFSDAAGLGGTIVAGVLNQEYEIQTVLTANAYTILASVTANASDTGNGGASTVGEYQVSIGAVTSFC
jgi:hypothetical protein